MKDLFGGVSSMGSWVTDLFRGGPAREDTSREDTPPEDPDDGPTPSW